jgi:hypothetical protein
MDYRFWCIPSYGSERGSFPSLSPCSIPPILMGGDTPVAVEGEGRVEFHNGSFENVLHVLKHSMNIISVYQIT